MLQELDASAANSAAGDLAAALDPGNPAGFNLGLHIVKEFTKLLKGRLEIESDRGKGSRIIVHLQPAQVKA